MKKKPKKDKETGEIEENGENVDNNGYMTVERTGVTLLGL